MSDFEKQCITLFVNHPLDWRDYLGCFNNPRYADRVISNLITHDKGIEFEIGPEIYRELKRVYRKSRFKRMTFDSDGNEVQVRVNQKSIRVLYDLYRFLSRSFLEDSRQMRSGIHIHSDFGQEMTNAEQAYLTRNLDDFVEKMARSYFHYEGRYNRNEFSTTKGFSMIYRRSFRTIEYRCIKMTWSFKELLLHLILTEKLTNYIRSTEKPKVDQLFKILNGMISLKESILKSNDEHKASNESLSKLCDLSIDTDCSASVSQRELDEAILHRLMDQLRESQRQLDENRELAAQRESQIVELMDRIHSTTDNVNGWTTINYDAASNSNC